MAFGGSGNFTFGSNNNNQGSGFGGFGSNNNTGAFGSSSNTAFGSNTASSNPFGGSSGGGFGGSGAGFGSNTNSGGLFGSKPSSTPFGSSTNTSGGGLFGSNTNTSGGFGGSAGGFGGNNAFGNNTNTGSTFGGFGSTANKPPFGSTSSTTPLFGQGGAGTTGGFGSSGGFGSATGNVPPSEGTAAVPFQPKVEKDGPTSNQTNAYQSINFMQPYEKYSFEELRLADYNAGRRFGTGGTGFGSNTFGGFGSTSNAGGFGSSSTGGGGLFGSNTSSSGGFGGGTSTSFGGSGGGGLFGQNKPASGGLFGNQSSATSSGGLFGTSNNTSGGLFGSNNNTPNFASSNAGGGLFGGDNQSQSKPGGLFGSTNTSSAGTGFSFGQNNTSSGSSGGLFGSNTSNTSGGGLFGNNNQQQNKPLFGGPSTGNFAQNNQQQSSGGLFGNTGSTSNTGGGLFGNASNTNSSGGGLFGSNASNTSGGGLFGSNNQSQNKPGGLFGGSTFGNNQQQNTGGGLFGNQGSTNQTSGGLFGGSNTNTSGGFNFGQNNANKPGGSLFGGNTTTNGQPGGMFGTATGGNNSSFNFGSSLNQSQNQQQQQQQDGVKHASLLDPNPYGQSSIWTGLPTPNGENSKPLVTLLTATQKLKESQAKPPPSLRLNQSRYMTPPRRQGYGFSYSTYGTPSSAASTPGGGSLSSSMYSSRFTGGSFGRSMPKSSSIGNLRSYYADGESVLSPGAFAPSSSRYSSGSIRRLTIDRSLKNDLFTRPTLPAPPAAAPALSTMNNQTPSSSTSSTVNGEPASNADKLKKRVSFDNSTTRGQSDGQLNDETGALVRTESDEDSTSTVNGVTPPSSSESTRGNELAVVPEDRESESSTPASRAKQSSTSSSTLATHAQPDKQPGDYWMKPTRAELAKLPREKLQNFVNFEVGRQGCGWVIFNAPVDLTQISLDDLFGRIVEIDVRRITVYPDEAQKPPRGKGLNVPSTLYIENSWPRAKGRPSSQTSGEVFQKHMNRLRRIKGTTFVNYDVHNGIWTFKVPHYTTYGLDYDDDNDMDASEFGTSQLSAPPDSIDQQKFPEQSVMEVDPDSDHTSAFGEDDTFHFKSKLSVPGGFGRRGEFSDLEDDDDLPVDDINSTGSEHSAPISRDEVSDDGHMDDAMDTTTSMAGAYPGPQPTLDLQSPNRPSLAAPGTPGKALLDLDLTGDWAEQLQRTISPRKQNRDRLRQEQSRVLLDQEFAPMIPAKNVKKAGFRSSLDVMNSLFDNRAAKQRGGDFEFPYAKRPKIFDESDLQQLSDEDKAWHASFKPSWTADGKLVLKGKPVVSDKEGWQRKVLLRSAARSVVMDGLKLNSRAEFDVKKMLEHAVVRDEERFPKVVYEMRPFMNAQEAKASGNLSIDDGEGVLLALLHVLFDEFDDQFSQGLSKERKEETMETIKRERLSCLLSSLLKQVDAEKIARAEKQNAAEAAVRYLACNDVGKAVECLYQEKNFSLAMLIAQIANADEMFQADATAQIEAWREQHVLSEMTEDVRCLYELCAGNTATCKGKDEARVAVEDRASTFSVSHKYGFNWLQMFALELWYGANKNSSIEKVIQDFGEQWAMAAVTASPSDMPGRNDPAWAILQLYAGMFEGSGVVPLILPQALESMATAWDSLNLFKLFNRIQASTIGQWIDLDGERADQLASTVAWELQAKGDIPGAVWALLHLQHPQQRGGAVLDLLQRHADKLPALPSKSSQASSEYELLVNGLGLTGQLIAQAKAIYERSEGDSVMELMYLIAAEQWQDAHECFCRRVAPRSVIDEGWDTLKGALSRLAADQVADWERGGQVYADFVSLVAGDKKMTQQDRAQLLKRLKDSLVNMGARLPSKDMQIGAGGVEELEQRVAVKEMGRVVAGMMEKGHGSLEAVMALPLTKDAMLRQAQSLAVEGYREVMAGAG